MAEQNGFEDFKFYHYDPSLPAAVIFAVVFAISTILHVFQLVRTRTWFFIAFAVGGLFQTIGYIGRAISHTETPDWTLGPYIIQTLLILLAPALFAASIYMELGRIILLVDGEKHAVIKRRFLTKIFVTGDVISFLTQSSGGGIMASGDADSVKTGEKIVIAGLFIQIVVFGFFVLTSAILHYRLLAIPTNLSTSTPWRKHLYALYAASAFILIRSIFRAIEYIQGFTGYLLTHEVFLYIFDALLMFVVVVIFNVIHPSEIKLILMGGKPDGQAWAPMRRLRNSNYSSQSESETA